ncbi:hypothetical protein B0H17DRAFT_1146891 [Mycena rosella]|uniref:Uncharacterized protein n=1 Tax=Mycena rosella TaxID=1033263 RepID=A0AAD7CMU6_MYCRO|nr:hypothetical protein B0H17DRAFT_1146891 [Mycena rosella]
MATLLTALPVLSLPNTAYRQCMTVWQQSVQRKKLPQKRGEQAACERARLAASATNGSRGAHPCSIPRGYQVGRSPPDQAIATPPAAIAPALLPQLPSPQLLLPPHPPPLSAAPQMLTPFHVPTLSALLKAALSSLAAAELASSMSRAKMRKMAWVQADRENQQWVTQAQDGKTHPVHVGMKRIEGKEPLKSPDETIFLGDGVDREEGQGRGENVERSLELVEGTG